MKKHKYFIISIIPPLLFILLYLVMDPNTQWLDHSPANNWEHIVDAYYGHSLPYTVFSILKWFLIITLLSIISIPLTLTIFHQLGDKGWIFSKVIFLLSLSIPIWFVSHLQIMPFQRSTLLVVIFGTVIVNTIISIKRWSIIQNHIKSSWRNIIGQEFIFLILFLIICGISSLSPDLYPSQGKGAGENAPDMIVLNSVLQSRYLPPLDIGFNDKYITNYYYFSFITISSLIHLTKTVPVVALHIFGSFIWAILGMLGFSIMNNLLSTHRNIPKKIRWFAGILTICLLLFSLSGIIPIKILNIIYDYIQYDITLNTGYLEEFWHDPTKIANTHLEPNFYILLVGNPVHPNVVSSILVMTSIGLFLNHIKLTYRNSRKYKLLSLASIGILSGTIVITSTWDLPITLVMMFGTIMLTNFIYRLECYISIRDFILQTIMDVIIIFLTFSAIIFPFIMHNESPSTKIQFISKFSIEISDILSFYFVFIILIILSFISYVKLFWNYLISNRIFSFWFIIYISFSFVVFSLSSFSIVYFTVPLIIFHSIFILKKYYETKSIECLKTALFVILCIAIMTSIPIAVNHISIYEIDLYDVGQLYANTNGVYKFYHVIWSILTLITVYILVINWSSIKLFLRFIIVFIVIMSCLHSSIVVLGRMEAGYGFDDITLDIVHPTKTNPMLPIYSYGYQYMMGRSPFPDIYDTLIAKNEPEISDGTSMMYHVPVNMNNEIDSLWWMRNNIESNAIVLEKYAGQSHNYNLGGRVAAIAGFRTVLASEFHASLFRGESAIPDISQRVLDIDTLYSSSTGVKQTLKLIDKYNITHIFIGYSERIAYGDKIDTKFVKNMSNVLEVIYSDKDVTILKRI